MSGADAAQLVLIRMMAIRSRERFQVITYSGDAGGADDKRDYTSVQNRVRPLLILPQR